VIFFPRKHGTGHAETGMVRFRRFLPKGHVCQQGSTGDKVAFEVNLKHTYIEYCVCVTMYNLHIILCTVLHLRKDWRKS